MIRDVEMRDIPRLCELYNHYVEHSVTTFEEVKISSQQLAHRIDIVTRNFPWLVVEEEGEVLGFAYGNYWKSRSAYRHTLETTIYLHHRQLGRGLGTGLYSALLERLLENKRVHRILSCISLPNAGSVALHEKLGFEKIGHFSEAGRKFERWVDVGYWQLIPAPAQRYD